MGDGEKEKTGSGDRRGDHIRFLERLDPRPFTDSSSWKWIDKSPGLELAPQPKVNNSSSYGACSLANSKPTH